MNSSLEEEDTSISPNQKKKETARKTTTGSVKSFKDILQNIREHSEHQSEHQQNQSPLPPQNGLEIMSDDNDDDVVLKVDDDVPDVLTAQKTAPATDASRAENSSTDSAKANPTVPADTIETPKKKAPTEPPDPGNGPVPNWDIHENAVNHSNDLVHDLMESARKIGGLTNSDKEYPIKLVTKSLEEDTIKNIFVKMRKRLSRKVSERNLSGVDTSIQVAGSSLAGE